MTQSIVQKIALGLTLTLAGGAFAAEEAPTKAAKSSTEKKDNHAKKHHSKQDGDSAKAPSAPEKTT